jgi:hypothetical protein
MARRVVVDGSNLATEGRSQPSLSQLNHAVDAFRKEHADDDVIVVVDASFGYRIDEAERKEYEQAELAGAIVSPPAGAIGRGDGFLLQIADRIGATVLSNDSFQEFHGEYSWLFGEGRLVGGKPVPGVGWIFTPRAPVRGPKSRIAVQEAKAKSPKAKAKKAPAKAKPKEKAKAKQKTPEVVEVIAEATADAIAPERGKRRRRRGKAPADPVNEPLPFITFIANHPLGSDVEGSVESFASHGAFVTVEGARCYVPITGLGGATLRSAKEVLARGETRRFVVQALDPPRRGIELALPGLAQVAGEPTEETVEAEIREARPDKSRPGKARPAAKAKAPAKKDAAGKKAPAKQVAGTKVDKAKAPAKKAGAAKKAPARKVPAKKTVAGKSVAGKSVAKKVVAKKAGATKGAAKSTRTRAGRRSSS